jgi:kumamolisin
MSNPKLDEQIRALALAVSDPESPTYGEYLTPDELRALIGPPLVGAPKDGGDQAAAPGEMSPREAALHAKGAADSDDGPGGGLLDGGPPDVPLGVTPADIARIYEVPAGYDGSGEAIGVLNLAGIPLDAIKHDLTLFWNQYGVTPPEITEVNVGGQQPTGTNMVARFDLTANVSWIGAMAPGARIVLYNTGTIDDAWTAMVRAAVAGDGGATVLTSAWTTPELTYYQAHPRRDFSRAMMEASLLGITMVNCAGNWGVYDGTPQRSYRGKKVCAAPWPNGVFPVVDPWVLGAGGTMITRQVPLTELGWSGPLPPNAQIRNALNVYNFAGSGGFSGAWGVPSWQKTALNLSAGQDPRGFPRGPNLPAVFPFGRGYPDVALMASGPAIEREGFGLAMAGYQIFFDGQPIDYAGGTSMATPIWGAFIALLNQSRQRLGLPRLGFANPLFYKLATGSSGGPEAPFREIEGGRSDIVFPTVDAGGSVGRFELTGFDAGPGWNPVTGVGVPRMSQLIEAVNVMARDGAARARAR